MQKEEKICQITSKIKILVQSSFVASFECNAKLLGADRTPVTRDQGFTCYVYKSWNILFIGPCTTTLIL